MPHFCLHATGRSLITWPQLAAREAGQVGIGWAVTCPAKNSVTVEKGQNGY